MKFCVAYLHEAALKTVQIYYILNNLYIYNAIATKFIEIILVLVVKAFIKP